MTSDLRKNTIQNTRLLGVLAARYPDKRLPVGAIQAIADEFKMSRLRVAHWAKANGYAVDRALPTLPQQQVLDAVNSGLRNTEGARLLGMTPDGFGNLKLRLKQRGFLP